MHKLLGRYTYLELKLVLFWRSLLQLQVRLR